MAANRRIPTVASNPSGISGENFAVDANDETSALWARASDTLANIGGTPNAITADAAVTLLAYESPNAFWLIPEDDNTGAVTININSLGAKNVRQGDGEPLEAGQLIAGRLYLIVYMGGEFRLAQGVIAGGTQSISLTNIRSYNTAGSFTWDKPVGLHHVEIMALGAGGGGRQTLDGTDGGDTSFGSLLIAGGGKGSTSAGGGNAGTVSGSASSYKSLSGISGVLNDTSVTPARGPWADDGLGRGGTGSGSGTGRPGGSGAYLQAVIFEADIPSSVSVTVGAAGTQGGSGGGPNRGYMYIFEYTYIEVGVVEGPVGPRGYVGQPGGVSWRQTFSTTTTNSDPGNGKVRLNTATQNAAVTIRTDLLSEEGSDLTNLLATLDDADSGVKGILRMFSETDPTKFIYFTLSAVATATGYRNLSVSVIASSATSPFVNDEVVVLTFSRTGDDGAGGTTNGIVMGFDSGTSDADPGIGGIRFNHATPSSATELYIDLSDAAGADITAWLALLDDADNAHKGTFRVQLADDVTVWHEFTVTGAVVTATGYRKVPVSYVAGIGSFVDADGVVISFFRSGDEGIQGIQGETGTSFVWRGAYDSGTAYETNDVAGNEGSSWVALQATTGNAPPSLPTTSNAYWELAVAKGDQGIQGIQGDQGIQGIQGIQGDQGIQGIQGDQGVQGEKGDASGMLFGFDNGTGDSDPGAGGLRFNNASPASVTELYIDNLEAGGGSVTAWLDSFDDSSTANHKGYLRLEKVDDPTIWIELVVTGSVVDGTGYRKVPVSYVAHSGSFADADGLVAHFSRTGDKGVDGLGAGDMIAATYDPNGYATDVYDRANHTGTQSADTVTDGTTNKAFTAAEKTKLGGVATGATANSSDATLLSRANHTGTQLAATISDFASAADARIANAIGKQTVWVPATAMIPNTTNGAAPGTVETANGAMFKTLDFDTTTQESACFTIAMPKGWDEGTVTFVPYWSHPATTTNFGVVFELSGRAMGDSDAWNATFGTAQTSTDTGGTTDDVWIGPESAAITIAGSPAENDLVMFRVRRVPANGSDTMAVDARLIGIKVLFTINSLKDD